MTLTPVQLYELEGLKHEQLPSLETTLSLLDAKETLEEELEDAREEIENKELEISSLQSEIVDLQSQLKRANQERTEVRRQLLELCDELKS